MASRLLNHKALAPRVRRQQKQVWHCWPSPRTSIYVWWHTCVHSPLHTLPLPKKDYLIQKSNAIGLPSWSGFLNANPPSQTKRLLSVGKGDPTHDLQRLHVRESQDGNCPSEPVIIWASYCDARCTVKPEQRLHLLYTPLQNETSQALM